MKKLLLIIALCGLAILAAAGQSNTQSQETHLPPQPSQASLLNLFPDSLPTERLEMMAHFQTRTMTRILGIDLEVSGLLPQLRRTDYPLHLINPLAPAHHGSGIENLSIDPVTRRVNGFVFLSIRF